MNNLQLKTQIRDKNYNSLLLVFQILLHEQKISKPTYDKLWGFLMDMEKNQPTKQDFINDLLADGKQMKYDLIISKRSF